MRLSRIRPFAAAVALLSVVMMPGFARADSTVTNCTQEALQAAINEGGTITFDMVCDVGSSNAIVLTNTITLFSDVTIDAEGQDIAITGDNLVRLFNVQAAAVNVNLIGLTLMSGYSTNGGALFINSNAQVSLSDCIFAGNNAIGSNGVAGVNGSTNSGTGGNGSAGGKGVPVCGGAIYNLGDLTIITCQFLTNSAIGGNGGNGGLGGGGGFQGGNGGRGGNGATGFGGAIYDAGTIDITDSIFNGNNVSGGAGGTGGAAGAGPFAGLPASGGAGAAAFGAALYSTQDATISGCTFSSNAAKGGDSATAGTGSDNNGSAGSKGGDALGGGAFQAGDAAITNCTFFGNGTLGGKGGDGGAGTQGGNGGNGGTASGGALYATGAVSVVNCTIASNSAQGGTNGAGGTGPFTGTDGSMGASRGGGVARAGGTFYLQNTILSTNAPGLNANGTITDGGHNLSSDSSLVGTSFKKTDPRLAPLADNGGPTATMALLAGSKAIDAGDDAAAPSVDQRGVSRLHADIGAFEAPISGISGQVLAGATGLSDVSVVIGTNLLVTDSRGIFSWTNPPPGVFDVTPSKTNYVFEPSSTSVSFPPDASGINFAAFPIFTISGHVLDGAVGVSNVTVTADTNTALTALDGSYTITGVRPGDYFVFATRSGDQFSPAQEVIVPPSATDINFSLTQPRFTISGRVLLGGTGLSGVRMFGNQTTDNNGNYSLSLPAGTNVIIPSAPGFNYTFNPASRTVVTPPDATNQDFVAGWLISSERVLPDGRFTLTIFGTGRIRIEESTNLVNWVSVYTNTASPTFQFTNGPVSSASALFYRAISP